MAKSSGKRRWHLLNIKWVRKEERGNISEPFGVQQVVKKIETSLPKEAVPSKVPGKVGSSSITVSTLAVYKCEEWTKRGKKWQSEKKKIYPEIIIILKIFERYA